MQSIPSPQKTLASLSFTYGACCVSSSPSNPACRSIRLTMLDSLPDALLHLVFVKLPPETLLTSVCFANKRFKRLITDSEVSCALQPLLRGLEAKLSCRRMPPPPAGATANGWRLAVACPSLQALWLSFLPPVLAKALREAPCSSASGCAPALRLPLLYGSLFHSNLLRNPWFSLEEQTAARRSRGQDVPGRAKTPWIAVGGGHLWAWGELAAEGLTAEAGATPPMPPPPLSPFSRQVRRSPAVRPSSCKSCTGNDHWGHTTAQPLLPVQGGPSQWPTGAVAAGSRGAGYDWPILMQEVDLVAEMQQPGLPRQAACDYLDTSPPLVFEVCPGAASQKASQPAIELPRFSVCNCRTF